LTALIFSYSDLSKISWEFNIYWASLSSSSVNFDVSLSVERWAVGCIALHSLSFQIYSFPFKLMKLFTQKHSSKGCS
jgi:hypothetical protein